MNNINDKTKRRLIIASGLIISVILIVLISAQFKKEPIEDVVLPDQSIEANDVIIENPVITEKEDEIIVPEIEILNTEKADNGGIDTGTEQTIQGDVEKPKEPTEKQLTDPTQKPNGEKVETPPEPVEHDKVEKPTGTPKSNDVPQGGDTNNKGQTYLPGFGWIENSGENQGTAVDGEGDINKQIGNMD